MRGALRQRKRKRRDRKEGDPGGTCSAESVTSKGPIHRPLLARSPGPSLRLPTVTSPRVLDLGREEFANRRTSAVRFCPSYSKLASLTSPLLPNLWHLPLTLYIDLPSSSLKKIHQETLLSLSGGQVPPFPLQLPSGAEFSVNIHHTHLFHVLHD